MNSDPWCLWDPRLRVGDIIRRCAPSQCDITVMPVGGRGESRRNSSNALTRSATLLDLGYYLPAHICLALDIAWGFEIGVLAKMLLAKLQLEIVQPTGFSSRKVFFIGYTRGSPTSAWANVESKRAKF